MFENPQKMSISEKPLRYQTPIFGSSERSIRDCSLAKISLDLHERVKRYECLKVTLQKCQFLKYPDISKLQFLAHLKGL